MVTPNAERDDFEASTAKTILISKVEDTLEKLDRAAERYRTQSHAQAIFSKSRQELLDLQQKIEAQNYDTLDAYHQVKKIIDTLEAQQNKLEQTHKQLGDDIVALADYLKSKIQEDMSAAQAQTKTKRDNRTRSRQDKSIILSQSKSALDAQPVLNQTPLFPEASNSSSPNGNEASSNSEENSQRNKYPDPITLIQVIQDEGVAISEETTYILEIIDHALADILGMGSNNYQQILLEVASALENADEA